MSSSSSTVDVIRMSNGSLPTPDALMVALLEQLKLLEKKDEVLEQKNSELQNQQARINVLEEQLRLMRQRKYGASSEKTFPSKTGWLMKLTSWQMESLMRMMVKSTQAMMLISAPSPRLQSRAHAKACQRNYRAPRNIFVYPITRTQRCYRNILCQG